MSAAPCAAGGLPAARLTLEVTESVLLHDARAAAETLARLRDMGIAIAIDDFGTGYSSLSYLQNLPVSILKIDKAFIASLPDSTPVVLAQTIVQLATTLGLKTVAEGIETDTPAADLQGTRLPGRPGLPVRQADALHQPRPHSQRLGQGTAKSAETNPRFLTFRLRSTRCKPGKKRDVRRSG